MEVIFPKSTPYFPHEMQIPHVETSLGIGDVSQMVWYLNKKYDAKNTKDPRDDTPLFFIRDI